MIDNPVSPSNVVRGQQLPEIRDAESGDLLPRQVILASERIYRNLEPHMHVKRSGLARYYVLDDRRIPVFTHQVQAYQDLSRRANDFRGKALRAIFDYTPEPTPSSLAQTN